MSKEVTVPVLPVSPKTGSAFQALGKGGTALLGSPLAILEIRT